MLFFRSNTHQQHTRTHTHISHGRLTECFQGSGGNAVAATYIIIDPSSRRKGYGRILMSLLEDVTLHVLHEYHYIYLWTQTAIQFYQQHCGYHLCQRTSMKRTCLKSLHAIQVSSLESLLVQRRQQQQQQQSHFHTSQTQQQPQYDPSTETIMLPPDDDDDGNNNSKKKNKDDDVWLCKRLVEQVPPIQLPVGPRTEQLKQSAIDVVHYINKDDDKFNDTSQHARLPSIIKVYYYWINNVPWEQQIGPSCGLASIRMVQGYFTTKHKNDVEIPTQENSIQTTCSDQVATAVTTGGMDDSSSRQPPLESPPTMSLLQYAKTKGWTVDGELFDMTHLYELTSMTAATMTTESSSKRYDCSMQSLSKLTPHDIYQGLLGRTDGDNSSCDVDGDGLWIIPYDSHPHTRLPSSTDGGHHAHYGIIVGIAAVDTNPDNHDTMEQDTTEVGPDSTVVDAQHVVVERHGQPPHVELHSLLRDTNGNDADDEKDLSKFAQQLFLDYNDNNHNNLPKDKKVLLLVQHSLSRDLVIASWDEFVSSNQQLLSYDALKFIRPTSTATAPENNVSHRKSDGGDDDNSNTRNNSHNIADHPMNLRDRIIFFRSVPKELKQIM